MADLRELYECRPSLEIFQRTWHPNAVFEDPLVKAKGFREYAAQFYALPKLFSKSETVSSRVMSSTRQPNRLVFTQKQRYKNRFMNKVGVFLPGRDLGLYTKTIESVITVDLDEDDRIIRIVDQWQGKPLQAEWRRRLGARVGAMLVRTPSLGQGSN
ncbi:hypothetical protein FB45DRAFT_912213 [Roridomyces roridus]|uniref:Uncharacterized protein n=1 Tax=Roridomyces roridus TaxID=1738132 RepID=A0AAD7AXR0_9AGAR|nr:hypothetical protein FB45DRAFT_966378 [Roridomyces roridus]KAJ7632354.1 hypothetical protein FB45DRAFT_912213 [Roridomyces roridus]